MKHIEKQSGINLNAETCFQDVAIFTDEVQSVNPSLVRSIMAVSMSNVSSVPLIAREIGIENVP